MDINDMIRSIKSSLKITPFAREVWVNSNDATGDFFLEMSGISLVVVCKDEIEPGKFYLV